MKTINKKINLSAINSPGQSFIERLTQSNSDHKILLSENGSINSIIPSEFLFGYTYHSHMIPPFKPESILILGYGYGTIAELIRKVYGQVKIDGVDINTFDWQFIENKMIIADAYEYVKGCTNHIIKTRYDYIVIDLWDGDKVPSFVFDSEFAIRLNEMTKRLLCINTELTDFDKLKPYMEYGFKFHRHIHIFGNTVSYWGI